MKGVLNYIVISMILAQTLKFPIFLSNSLHPVAAGEVEFQPVFQNEFFPQKLPATVHYLLWCEFNTLPRGTDGSGPCLYISQADGGAVGYQHQGGFVIVMNDSTAAGL